MIHLTIEEIYKWIEVSFEKTASNPNMIINCFKKAGFTTPDQVMEEELIQENIKSGLDIDVSEIFERPDSDDQMEEEFEKNNQDKMDIVSEEEDLENYFSKEDDHVENEDVIYIF